MKKESPMSATANPVANLDPITIVSDAVRLAVSQNPSIGAGNFFAVALANSPAPAEPILFLEKPLRTFWGETLSQLSILDLDRLAGIYASFYQKLGVKPQDPVFVYLDDGAEYLVHYLALVRIGAIGVLTNGNMPAQIAAAHAKNVGVVGVFTDASHLPALAPFLAEAKHSFVLTEEQVTFALSDLEPARAYRHDAEDPIMIAHSSGTTGIPKAVLLQSERFFHGVRYRLAQPRIRGGERIFSSLPHSHNCAIAYITLALLSGTPVYVSSDHSGAAALRLIAEFRPTMVVSFPQTYVEMTEQDLDAFDLSSVNLWFNGGDAAHESHIRALIARGSHDENGVRVPGSVFIDGMGSSEMGFSLFRNVHTPRTNHYNRCIGTPLEWVDAQILAENGDKLGPSQVGRLGVKAPSVTTGYWNNSLLTYRSRLSGYFLTGDLAYKDADGRFYHVDRVPDVILTAQGAVYGLQTEEALLSRFAGIADCSVLGQKLADSDLQVPVAYLRLRPGSDLSALEPAQLLERLNAGLKSAGLPAIAEARLAEQPQIPLGTTGKVLKRVLRTSDTAAAPQGAQS
jgi:acyl-coenzyme A synthetase/AMP-(fatty) acid ligase